MTTLALKNMPDELYNRLEKAARAKQLSVGEEALQALEKGLEHEESDTHTPTASFWDLSSIEQLAANQQVCPPSSPDDLAGDWPEEDSIDEFLETIQAARR